MKRFIILILFVLTFALYAQEENLSQKSNATFKELKIQFFAEHLFKTVKGECKSPKIENLKIISKSGQVSAEVPFIVRCSILNMHTGDDNRDSHMWEVLGYPQHKEIQFLVEKLESATKTGYSFQGKLTIKGKTKPISFTAISSRKNDTIKINAEFSILLSDFEVERPSVVFTSIKDKVKIEWEVLLVKVN